MELYACGFNAHGQLTGDDVLRAPEDVEYLERICQGDKIRVLFTGWADTLLEVDGELLWYTVSGRWKLGTTLESNVTAAQIVSGFGDHSGLQGVLTADGRVLTPREIESEGMVLRPVRGPNPERGPDGKEGRDDGIQHIVIAGNGKTYISLGGKIYEFSSLPVFFGWYGTSSDPPPSKQHLQHLLPSAPTQLVAGETSVTALLSSSSAEGTHPPSAVYTWGDARHNHLGRTITPDAPSTVPHIVHQLGGIPIRKIATGGWMTAALSTSDDLYLWGGRRGDAQRIRALPALTPMAGAEVQLVDIGGGGGDDDHRQPEEKEEEDEEDQIGLDVLDVAVGSGHVLVATRDGRLWTAGRGQNGQLAGGRMDFQADWAEVAWAAKKKSSRVEAVFCGPCSSFVLVRTAPASGSVESQ